MRYEPPETTGHLTQSRNGVFRLAELGIADLLIDGPRTAEELAKLAHAHGDGLYRVLRALASIGIFREDAERRFSLTPMAECLRSDRPDSLRSFAIMAGAEFYQSWGHLLHSAQTGEPGFHKRFGVPFFQYMTEHPERHAIYDAAMMVHGIAETVIPPLNEPCFGKWLDLMMLIVAGRERTREQYEQLFAQAGLKLNRIVPTAHEVSIIEAVPAT